MDNKIKKNILIILKDHRGEMSVSELESELDKLHDNYNFKHCIKILEDESLVKISKQPGILLKYGSIEIEYIELTAEGYKEFASLYRKIMNFMKGDLTTILAIIATILSIISNIRK